MHPLPQAMHAKCGCSSNGISIFALDEFGLGAIAKETLASCVTQTDSCGELITANLRRKWGTDDGVDRHSPR